MKIYKRLTFLVLTLLWATVQTQATSQPFSSKARAFRPLGRNERSSALYPYQKGFPLEASSWMVLSSPAVADLDNDGDNELVVANGIGTVDGWDHNGTTLPGFPLNTHDETIFGQLALGDLDGDNDLEIVTGSKMPASGNRGHVYVWHHTGNVMNGWPKSVMRSQYSSEPSEVRSVALADVDGDGDLEVLAGTINNAVDYPGPDPPDTPNLYGWQADGTLLPGDWPNGTAAIYGAIAAGDLNGDGKANIIAGRDHHFLYAYADDGALLSGWPISTFLNANVGDLDTDIRIVHFNSAPVIADLDGDDVNEYIVSGNVKYPGENIIRNSGLLVLGVDGTRRPGWETAALGDGILYDRLLPQKAPAIADLNRDGQMEIIISAYDGWIRAYQLDQSLLWALNFAQGEILFASEPVIGDIDGDRSLEILFGTYDPTKQSDRVGVWGLKADGTPIPGFPLFTDGIGIRAAPTLADLDRDGDLEILASGWGYRYVFAWDTPAPYAPAYLPWPTGRHDLRRSATFVRTAPDLSSSRKIAIPPVARQDETVTFVIQLDNTGETLLPYTLRLTDTVPSGLTYVPGSLDASHGTVDDTSNLLKWSGTMSDTFTVLVWYQVTVTTDETKLISNIAMIDTAVAGLITRTAQVLVNGKLQYLPLIMREATR